jgi:FKBP-type peptidyl-prolyl cis-trans isomerase FklB
MKISIYITLMLLGGVFFFVSCQTRLADVSLKSELDSVSYCIGLSIGSNLKSSPMKEINYLAMAKGMEDGFGNDTGTIDPYEANRIISVYLQRLENEQTVKNSQSGKEFLEQNKNKSGVITLESGLQYRVIREGTGPKPKLTDNVTVHYHGTLIDGTVFDSSVDRGQPASFPVNGVIQGWQEALQLMPVGSKWELFIPSELAYGNRPMPGSKIGPNSVLIFEVELISINEPKPEK